ncbi:MAG: nucleotide sugar dehydrogenase [Spirochaetia bacterium]|nr:nucleotide sugar dehydrogenase [Spirochaetia bacterium]
MGLMIAVVGMGFVGLTTALGLAEKGFRVVGVESNEARSGELLAGRVPFHEPDLADGLARHLGKNFQIEKDFSGPAASCDTFFFCVGTPGGPDGSADLTALLGAIEAAVRAAENKSSLSNLVVKSTVPPGTLAEKVAPVLRKQFPDFDKRFALVSNPEFLREGSAWKDFLFPDRVVVGVENNAAWEKMKSLYEPFGAPIHRVSWSTAEFVKYLSNSFLSTLISFSNELSLFAHRLGGIDIPQAFKVFHEDRRWSGAPAPMSRYAFPGGGFGGYCLPKDTEALAREAEKHGASAAILRGVLDANLGMPEFWANEVDRLAPEKARLGILGLSFKPGSDDVRDSPTARLIAALLRKDRKEILAYDPLANDIFSKTYDLPIRYAKTLEELVSGSDHLVLATAWPEFLEKKALIKTKPLTDTRYFLI